MTLTLGSSSKAIDHGEAALVEAARAGDDRAFEQLYSRYRQRIFSFILSRVHDHGRAEDIAQEVFIAALRRLRDSEGRIAFKPWIYEIAKNACIDEYRRGNRSREVPLETDGELITDRQSTLRSAPTPAAAIEGKQRLDDLRGAFGGLSTNHHRLLVMREFEGLSYEEIGARLGMTRPMVESSLFRARRKLTEEYEELASGRRCEQVQHAIAGGRLSSASALGLRDRRRFARHLSHCQPCRHVALAAGVDHALVQPRRLSEKIAALIPFPILRRLLSGRNTALGQPGATALGGRAAAAAAAVALAGVGGGVVHALGSGGSAGHRALAPNVVAAADVTGPSMATPAVLPRTVIRTAPARSSAGRHRGRAATMHLSHRAQQRATSRSVTRHHPAPRSDAGTRTAPRSTTPAATVPGAGLPKVTPHLPSLTSTINRTVQTVTGPNGPAGSNSPIGKLVDSTPLGAAVGTVTGLASTIASGATSVLGSVTGASSSGSGGTSGTDSGTPGSGSGAAGSAGSSGTSSASSGGGATAPVSGAISSATQAGSGLLGGH